MLVLSFDVGVCASLITAMAILPCLVLLQKIIPSYVEATMMAFSITLVNLSINFIGNITGLLVNKYFVGVTSTNLKNMYMLPSILIFFRFYCFVVIQLIPLNSDII